MGRRVTIVPATRNILPFDGHFPAIAADVYLASNAMIIGDVTIDTGASVWFGCVLRGDERGIRIGADTNIQDGVVMHAAPMEGRFFAGVRFVGIGLIQELELSRFVLNEDRLQRANRTDREPAGAGAGISSDDRSGRWGRSLHSRLAAAS